MFEWFLFGIIGGLIGCYLIELIYIWYKDRYTSGIKIESKGR